MIRLKDAEALAHLERRMIDTFDVGYHEYVAGTAKRLIPTAYFNLSKRIADVSGIMDLITQWDAERRKSKAGKKAILPLRALIVIYLLNAQMGFGVTYLELARTIAHRLSADHRAALGIRSDSEDTYLWYRRISETSYRLIALMNPRPAPLRAILDAHAFEELLTTMDTPSAKTLADRNQARLDQFCNLLVEASLRQLPKDLWNKYQGNIAIDATKVHIRGRLNSASLVGNRSNPDPLAGRYRREGNHDGTGAKTDVSAYELETSVMIWNKPGENTLFPSLVSVISCHNPGRLTGHAPAHMRRQKNLGFDRFTVVVDRAYNGEQIENFHIPAAHLGLDLVFDYRRNDLGKQSHFEDLFLVDGSWYVNWLPQGLIDVTAEYRDIEDEINAAKKVIYTAEHFVKKEKTTPAQILAMAKDERVAAQFLRDNAEALVPQQERLAMREPYRMIAKGRRDLDGYQRLSYPPLEKMLVGPPASRQKRSTITVPPTLDFDEKVACGGQSSRKSSAEKGKTAREKQQPIKHWQNYAYKSPEWRSNYGMRSLVESSNSLLKTKDHGDIETPTKRSGRGYAATYLALAYAVVASNLKRIATFFANEALRIEERSKLKHRTRRRRDDLGRPLALSRANDPPAITT